MAVLKKHNLNDWIDDELTFHVLGISSYLPDYQLVYRINQNAGCRFLSSPFLYTLNEEEINCRFSFYKNKESRVFSELYLIVNQSVQEASYAVPTPLFGEIAVESTRFLKNFTGWDYLLIGNNIDEFNSMLLPKLKQLFTAVHLFDFQQLKKLDISTLTTFYYENKC